MKKMLVRGLLATTLFACGGGMDTNVDADADAPPAQPAVLIDSVQWNNEKLEFFDSPSDDGSPSEVLVTMLAPNNEPELLLTLEDQLGRTPTAAEIYLAAGGSLNDVPEELLAAHEVVAEQEGLDPTPERPEIDADRVQEKTITQPIFNQMFPPRKSPPVLAPCPRVHAGMHSQRKST